MPHLQTRPSKFYASPPKKAMFFYASPPNSLWHGQASHLPGSRRVVAACFFLFLLRHVASDRNVSQIAVGTSHSLLSRRAAMIVRMFTVLVTMVMKPKLLTCRDFFAALVVLCLLAFLGRDNGVARS